MYPFDDFAITEYERYSNLAEEYQNKHLIDQHEWLEVEYSDLKINDCIVCYFHPDSQKHIYDLYPKYGKVIEITSERSNDHSSVHPSNTTERSNDHSVVLAEIIPSTEKKSSDFFSEFDIENIIIEFNNNKEKLSHQWASYLGNNRGYSYTIHKLVKISEDLSQISLSKSNEFNSDTTEVEHNIKRRKISN